MLRLFTILISYFALIANICNAQQYQLKTGPKLEGAEEVKKMKVVNNEPYVVSCGKYDKNMQSWHLSSQNLSPIGNPKYISASSKMATAMVSNDDDFNFLEMVEVENKYVIFYSKYDKNLKVKNLYYKELDASFEPISKETAVESGAFKQSKSGLNLFSWTYKDLIWFKTN